MKNGIIIKSLTDLRAKPDFRSERKSQLLYNEPVKIDKYKNGYCRVIQLDGYFGWVNEKAVQIILKAKQKEYLSNLNYRLKSKTARLNNKNNNSSLPEFLFYGTEVYCFSKKNNECLLKDIDGNSYTVLKSNLELISKIKKAKGSKIISDAKKFLDVPYLWGGISPFGFDCSGFVRTIFRQFNIELPRDSGDQSKIGEQIKLDRTRSGDLLFFKGHVAIVLNKDLFIHASLGAGGVVINTLKTDDVGFRKDLYDTFICARRILL